MASRLTKIRAAFLIGQPSRWPVVACATVLLNLGAWFAVAWVYGLSPFAPQNSALLLRAGAVNLRLLTDGEWWRILTSQFLHVRFPHLLFNMLAVLLLGGMLERELGAWRLAALYILSGTVGQLAGVMAAPMLVSSGASQAAMGLAGGVTVGLLRRRLWRTTRLMILLAVVAVQFGLDLMAVGHIKAGHLAGFIAGAAIGYLLYVFHDRHA